MVNPTYEKLGSAPSMIRELFAYGLRRSAEVGPEHVYDYSLGNPSIPAPQPVQQALLDVLHDTDPIQVHGYSMAGGFDGTRRAVAEDLTRRFGMTIRPEELFFTCGAAAALISVIRALTVSPDSEFVAIAPYFPEYLPFVESNGGKLVSVPADLDTFQISLDILEAHLTSHTQAVLVNSPNNPTGCIYDHESLTAVYAAAKEHPIFVLCDEVYRDLIYTDAFESFHQFSDLRSRIIEVQSFSKPYAMTGWRVGYLMADRPVKEQLEKIHQYNVVSISSFVQRACAAALAYDISSEREVYRRRRDYVCTRLDSMGLPYFKPQGAFYVFPSIAAFGMDSLSFCSRMVKEGKLACTPGSCFGAEGFLRISYCYSDDVLREGMDRMETFVQMLRSC